VLYSSWENMLKSSRQFSVILRVQNCVSSKSLMNLKLWEIVMENCDSLYLLFCELPSLLAQVCVNLFFHGSFVKVVTYREEDAFPKQCTPNSSNVDL
jgi:hypothetical protein